VTFHGCSDAVKEMEETYHNRCSQFEDDDSTIYEKLLKIFDTPYFPAVDEENVDCNICMSYRCEDSGGIPIVYCDNSKCSSSFHIGCLEKYLKVKKHVTVLSICIGECPFCKHILSNSYADYFKNEANIDKREEMNK
jgi:FANCL C-terminal domain